MLQHRSLQLGKSQDTLPFCALLSSHKGQQHRNQDTLFKFNNSPLRAGQQLQLSPTPHRSVKSGRKVLKWLRKMDFSNHLRLEKEMTQGRALSHLKACWACFISPWQQLPGTVCAMSHTTAEVLAGGRRKVTAEEKWKQRTIAAESWDLLSLTDSYHSSQMPKNTHRENGAFRNAWQRAKCWKM